MKRITYLAAVSQLLSQKNTSMRFKLPILVMLLSGFSLSLSAQTVVDFTTMADAATYGLHSQVQVGAVWALWGGDVNDDDQVIDNASPSDASLTSNRVLSDAGNTGFFGSGPLSNYTGTTGIYEYFDVNLDGGVLDNVPSGSDVVFISNNVLIYPGNTGFFGSGPLSNFTGLLEQLP